ncbi:MAG TPA: transposase [Chloroflexi bacterium]|nr:transposase [Chloroflexota bacterium]
MPICIFFIIKIIIGLSNLQIKPLFVEPGTPWENGYVESFNRSLRKECLGWIKYQVSEIPGLTHCVEEWLQYYHYLRPHISLGIRPPLEIQV